MARDLNIKRASCPHKSLASDDGSKQYFHCRDCGQCLRLVGVTGHAKLMPINVIIYDQEQHQS